jgi:hypothetical protein
MDPRFELVEETAGEAGLPGQFPAGFAALAVDARDGLAALTATRLLAWQLRRTEDDPAGPEDDLAVYTAPWIDRPVLDSWRENLTSTDLGHARRLRQVRRLLEGGYTPTPARLTATPPAVTRRSSP